MRKIYNEGRIQGLSSYEIYTKLHQATVTDPTVQPASEREWLASSLAMGSSMLLKIEADTNHEDNENWTKDIQFPNNTLLCAANTIMASFFTGEGEYGVQESATSMNSNWANRVSDYGSLISNTDELHPDGQVGPTGNVPTQASAIQNWPQAQKDKLANYMKIVDGIIIQPGTWEPSKNNPPSRDLAADLGTYPRIRLLFKGPITTDFEVLLTGFSIRAVVVGETGLAGSTGTTGFGRPENGDYLGPGQFPWANKVIFSVPSSYIAYFASGAYTRKLPASAGEYQTVKDTAVIDMKTTQPETYYITNHPNARVQTDVSEFTTLGDGTAVLTVYQKKDIYPPALYGTFVDSNGTNYLNPLDVVAPGTIKMFENATEEELKDYEDTFDGTFGMNKNDDGTIGVLDKKDNLVPAADVTVQDADYTNPGGSSVKAKKVITKTGTKQAQSISISGDVAGNQYTVGADDTSNRTVGNTTANIGGQAKISPSTSNINWAALLEALANNKSIDLLGDNLKLIKAGISRNYIQFPNGLRLYISSTEPPDDDVPEGSIGIGWGFYQE